MNCRRSQSQPFLTTCHSITYRTWILKSTRYFSSHLGLRVSRSFIVNTKLLTVGKIWCGICGSRWSWIQIIEWCLVENKLVMRGEPFKTQAFGNLIFANNQKMEVILSGARNQEKRSLTLIHTYKLRQRVHHVSCYKVIKRACANRFSSTRY